MDVDLLAQIQKPTDLVNRVHCGDVSAESEFVKRYSRSLFLLLYKRTNGDEFVAKDCTQEALLITLAKMRSGNIRNPAQISVFLRQTAINVSVEYYRKLKRFVSMDDKTVSSLHTKSTAEIEINSEQILSILKEVLNMLPMSRDREILNRFFLLEHSKKEICEGLDLSSDHFDRVLFRAKNRLRVILNDNKPLGTILHSELIQKVETYG